MRNKSVLTDAGEVKLAIELVKLGARLQVLEAETSLSRERLLKLYKEVRGESPPKGMLPFSTDWFMTWAPNIHASLYIGIYRYLKTQTSSSGIAAVMRAYQLYLEHVQVHALEKVLSFTRAWSLVRFFDAKMLSTAACTQCHGDYVVHALDLNKGYVCGLCNVPSRAGKTKRATVAAVAEPAVEELAGSAPAGRPASARGAGARRVKRIATFV